MKLSDLVKRKEYNQAEFKNLELSIIPIESKIEEIHLKNIKDESIYLSENRKIIAKIDKSLLSYLQKQKKINILPNILNHIEEGVVAIDEEGRIFYVNDGYSKILGVPIYKIIGKYIQEIEKDALAIKVLETKEGLYKVNTHIKSINKYINVNITPFFVDNIFKGVYSIFHDVTEIRNLNREVTRISHVVEEYSRKLEIKEKLENFNIIGEDKKFIDIINKSLIVSKTDVSVLILGENGSGKDILSQFIHNNSNREQNSFIIFNCASIPETLIESELFGYDSGAFTGAKKHGKIGKFELADQGTIFLDEIGDMSLSMQVKLLRTLETGEIEKIGSESKICVNVRVIAATNQDLEKKIQEGKFREDLFYRLSTVTLELPPLRERGNDILLFIHHFLDKYNKKYHKNTIITNEVYSILMEYRWPGNIRELKNCIEHAVILANDNKITLEFLPKKFLKEENSERKKLSLEELLKQKEKEILINKLTIYNGNLKKVQKVLNISERTLYRKIKKYGIKLS
ncbi:Anaerobic nitric oxide reductase transcription regulator NorR [Fusobacterium necrophorum]|uniref:sigma-54 interaction domain-containing protein n=1 Tax=Fusobacterium necrophorum TaxID=859 RepID=UPI000460B7D1|nr:sigma 54-interacting transcriptional regulator [Fusobacterium necrophorum]KDE65961.1 diguanylate cyclase [Fusobacterium necrophorum BFTR-1]MBR8734366.1 Anaerobic nitric oxide reductase transcription regulator NorR [Fusobacterium necrophorum]MBR8790542.1 Anaerobic nitric oxide reductase transcription regulator NorR [Fusobacterium necrophorum]